MCRMKESFRKRFKPRLILHVHTPGQMKLNASVAVGSVSWPNHQTGMDMIFICMDGLGTQCFTQYTVGRIKWTDHSKQTSLLTCLNST